MQQWDGSGSARSLYEVDLGFMYLLYGNLDRAIGHFEKSSQLDTYDPLAVYDLGMAYLLRGDSVRALEEYKKAIEIDRQTQFSWIRAHLRELSRYCANRSAATCLLEPGIKFLQEVCEKENVPTCPDISDVLKIIDELHLVPEGRAQEQASGSVVSQ
jgi:Tfp pilus assembly protein PilF